MLPIAGFGVLVERHVDLHFTQEGAVAVEHLDAPIVAVADIDVALGVGGDAVDEVELALALAALAPGLDPVAVLADLGDARIHVAVGNVDRAVRSPGHVGRLAEAAVLVRQRLFRVALVGLGFGVGRLGLAPEHHRHPALRVELDDHVGAFVGGPDVVVLVDAHSVRERPGVEILADLADEFALGIELQDLRGGVAVRRTGARSAARIDEDVALGVDRNAGGLAEVHVVGQLQQIGHRLVGNGWRVLCERGGTDQRKQRGNQEPHGIPPSSLLSARLLPAHATIADRPSRRHSGAEVAPRLFQATAAVLFNDDNPFQAMTSVISGDEHAEGSRR